MSEGGGLTFGQLSQISAWALGICSLLFSTFGIKAGKDIFLVMGLITVLLGDIVFAFFLTDMSSEEGANDTAAATFLVLACLVAYALYRQWDRYREEGCTDPEDALMEEEVEAEGQAGDAAGADSVEKRLGPKPEDPLQAAKWTKAKLELERQEMHSAVLQRKMERMLKKQQQQQAGSSGVAATSSAAAAARERSSRVTAAEPLPHHLQQKAQLAREKKQ